MGALENERLMVLKMVGESKISAEDGSRLLASLGEKRIKPELNLAEGSFGARWFRVRVTNLATGTTKASVNIPLALASWGLNIGAQFTPEVADFDLQELAAILKSGYQGKLIDVVDEEDNEHVEIFVE